MDPAAIEPGFDPADAWSLGLLFLGLAVMVAIVALTHQRSRAFSPSVVYLGLGLVGAAGAAVLDADWLDLIGDAEVVERVAELAVIVALFATGLRLDRPITFRGWRTTILLLGVVMPVTIAAVAAFGVVAMGLSAGAAIVLGAALAPTDPVLAGDLGVGPPGEEDETETSFALTSEAGLNDGLAFPFVFLGLAVAEHGAAAGSGTGSPGTSSTPSSAASRSGRPADGSSQRSRPASGNATSSPSSWTATPRSAPSSPSTAPPRSSTPTASSPPSSAASRSAAGSATTSTPAASTPAGRCSSGCSSSPPSSSSAA